MTASHDRRAHGRRPRLLPLLRILLVAAVLTPVLSFASPVAPARADALSDAIAEQQRLAKLIADQNSQLAKLGKQQTSLKSQIAATQQNLAGVRVSLDEAQSQITSLQGEVNGVTARYNRLVSQQFLLKTEIAQLTVQQDAKQRELEVRQEVLASRLKDAYVTDQTPLLQQLLTAGSLTEALSDVSYYGDLAEADNAVADKIRQDQEILANLRQTVDDANSANKQITDQVGGQKKELDDQNTQLLKAQSDLSALRKQLEDQLAQQQAADAKLASNKAALDATIRSNGQALDDLAAKIDSMIAGQGGSGRIPSQFSGQLHWPMGGVITQEFGCTGVASEPRVGNCAHFHQGIDLAAPCLTPVYAAGAGVVMFAGYNPYDAPPRAWLVIIAHSTSMVTWYAHMTGKAPPGIYVGAQVASGQLVGTENTTGHSSGCHLHWAVRVNGQFLNPRLFL
jgi:murein DD-endopeptidase MepM/ murein hydrolase activator NlpD